MMRTLLVALFCLQAAVLSGQKLADSQFRIADSAAGLTSLKRVGDLYDTDYLAPGKTLGDVLIRYRAVGDPAWKQALSATGLAPAAPERSLSYAIARPIPTLATASRPSSSAGTWGLTALNDQLEPKKSDDSRLPFFSWGDRKGSEEWVQYDFGGAQQVSSSEVYWAEARGENRCQLPRSWRLQYREGEQWKDVRASGEYQVAPDRFNHVDFEAVTTDALRLVAELPENATSGIFEWRVNSREGKQVEPVEEIEPRGTFQLAGNTLLWTITVRNRSSHPVEIGDLGIPLPFNTQYVWDKTETYTKRLIRHSFIGGGGSYVFWMRTNAEGPYLLMVPEANTALEYFDQGEEREFTAYVHASARGAELKAKGGKWRLPTTNMILAAKGHRGDSLSYGFRFRWAKDYDGVRDVLYQEGAFDVSVVPGMTVPTDLAALVALRTRNRIRSIDPEFPEQTEVKRVREKGSRNATSLYRVKFSRLGENMLKVRYGDLQYLSLEFFVTEPLETLIKKRARFLVTHEQWRDPKRWYNGLYSQWDMKHQVLRSPDDLDGLQSYAVACDDTALGKAPYLAAKNVFFPEQTEIDSLENYIRQYVWGGLQQSEKEPYPYAIYGIPNWKANRDSPWDDTRGKKHVWRIYDYPHVVLLYYQMYRIAKNYPGMVHYLDPAGYLERSYRTAIAFFTVPLETAKWSADETGTYNELVIPDLIQALEDNGRRDEADELRTHWETKVKYFVNQRPYLFGSEYPFDSTGFESTEALAKYAMARLEDPAATAFQGAVKRQDAEYFLAQQMKLNLACRGMEPAYYWLGSDYRASGNSSYTLSYMAQMGGWAVEDYAVNFARDPVPYLRLGYASYLSSWALLNSGTAESNYGYWYPGQENDGGAGGGFEPRPWGRAWLGNKEMGRGSWWYSGEIDLGFSAALRTAATVVSDDPVFGLIAYGGDLTRAHGSIQVVPKDGLRTRFYVVRGTTRFQMALDRDGFSKDRGVRFDERLSRITFTLENRSHDEHQTILELRGLPSGTYHVWFDREAMPEVVVHHGEPGNVKLPVGLAGGRVVISRP